MAWVLTDAEQSSEEVVHGVAGPRRGSCRAVREATDGRVSSQEEGGSMKPDCLLMPTDL